jgi:hypothetical protein
MFRREDEFLLRNRQARILLDGVEGIHGQLAFDLDRFLVVLAVEHDPAAESAYPALAGLMQNGISPDVHHLGGRLGLFQARQGDRRQVQRCASSEQQYRGQRQEAAGDDRPAVPLQGDPVRRRAVLHSIGR